MERWRTWPKLGGQAYCFGRMTSHISIVLEQKTIVFQNIGGHCPPSPPPPSVCHWGGATNKFRGTTEGLLTEQHGFRLGGQNGVTNVLQTVYFVRIRAFIFFKTIFYPIIYANTQKPEQNRTVINITICRIHFLNSQLIPFIFFPKFISN